MTAAGPFLRPSQPRRRRRRSILGRAARWVARFLPVLVLPAAAWFWVSDGDTFALSAVETEGSPRISPDWIEHALAPELGTNLLALPLDRVRRRLEENPWLGRIEARKELPHVLRVRVEERVAAAVLETEDGLYYMDADGDRIARLEPHDTAASLVRIAAGSTAIGISPALATSEASSVRHALAIETALVQSSGPEWRLPVLWVEVVGDDDYRVYLGSLPFPILVRSHDVARRIELLEELRPAILERAPILAEVDLRFERRVIVRPALEEIAAAAAAAERAASNRGAGDSGADAVLAPPSGEAPAQSTRSSVWDPQPKET
jgi:hypothetical protein